MLNSSRKTRKEIAGVLNDFISKKLQRRAWIDKDPSVVFVPSEFVEWLDDLGLSDREYIINSKILTNEQYLLVDRVNQLLLELSRVNENKDYLYDKNPEKLLEEPLWSDIAMASNDALLTFGQ